MEIARRLWVGGLYWSASACWSQPEEWLWWYHSLWFLHQRHLWVWGWILFWAGKCCSPRQKCAKIHITHKVVFGWKSLTLKPFDFTGPWHDNFPSTMLERWSVARAKPMAQVCPNGGVSKAPWGSSCWLQVWGYGWSMESKILIHKWLSV